MVIRAAYSYLFVTLFNDAVRNWLYTVKWTADDK